MTCRSRRGDGRSSVARLGIDRADAELLELLDVGFAEARRRAGSWLACRSGCADCCHGPFPVTSLDVRRLRRGMEHLSSTRPDRAHAIHGRAALAVEVLAEGFPGDAASGRLTHDESRLDPFFERHASLACPVLDPEAGTCDLHAWRPVSCRTYGPPLRFGEKLSPPCGLCFRGATQATVERCRIEPDRDGAEAAILAHMGAAADEHWETLIAHALVDDQTPRP